MDILLPLSPEDDNKDAPQPIPKTPRPSSDPRDSEFWRSTSSSTNKKAEQKLLFTVKPGGIAGYLGQCIPKRLVSFHSHADF